ncbi:MAG: hypothetical protein IJX17_05505, partial [Clostridia bacterium]|nr:hypothetical protein [Clostridia bacterium]
MKLSSLKVVGVFMIATIAIIAGGLSIYFLIQNNKTYYIYDIRIVEPLEDTGYFVYTNKEDSEGNEPEYDLVSMQNKNVFLTNSEANKFEIGVYADTSTNTTSIDITSSNTDIATISYSKGRCFVEYHRAGQVEITAEYGGVSDSITVNVYDNVSESFLVYDEAFYGKYHTTFNNNI